MDEEKFVGVKAVRILEEEVDCGETRLPALGNLVNDRIPIPIIFLQHT